MDSEALGEILGEVLGIDTMGDLDGMSTVGRRHRGRHHGHHGGHMPVISKPGWRQHQLAPGVQAPREGMEPLPLSPSVGNGVFSATVTNINYTARPQRPFRGERLLVQVIRSGTSAAASAPLASGIFVGTALQQLQIGNIPLEFFSPSAFGVRMDLLPAEPGIDITFQCLLTAALTSTDTLTLQMMLLGRSLGQ